VESIGLGLVFFVYMMMFNLGVDVFLEGVNVVYYEFGYVNLVVFDDNMISIGRIISGCFEFGWLCLFVCGGILLLWG